MYLPKKVNILFLIKFRRNLWILRFKLYVETKSITFISALITKYSSKLYLIIVFFQNEHLKSTLGPLGIKVLENVKFQETILISDKYECDMSTLLNASHYLILQSSISLM
jgi:hypothetical protein